MKKANDLLYGRRRQGTGPRLASSFAFDQLADDLFAGRLPASWQEMSIRLVSEPYRSKGRTVVYLDGIADRTLTLSLVRDGEDDVVSLDYSDYRDGAPSPASPGEKRLLRHLAASLDEAKVEFACSEPHQLAAILEEYDQLALAPPRLGRDSDEGAILSELGADCLNEMSASLLRESDSLDDLLADPRGRDALLDACRAQTIYLQRPFSLFKE